MRVDFAFLDSGTGGLPYMKALKNKLPSAKCVYLGDTAHFPYGEKSFSQVAECASLAVDLIIKKWNPKTIVVACNTISVTALDILRKNFPQVPIVGTVPAIKLAGKISVNRKIGLLATNATVNHPYCRKLIQDFASDCQVFNRGDPELISFIEKNLFTSTEEQKIEAVKNAVDFFKANECDTVILGCTHFTHIADVMKKSFGEKVNVVDSREGVANQALKQFKLYGKNESCEGEKALCVKDCTFFVTEASESETEEYVTLCKNMDIPWGGTVEFSK
ncbi:MAG: glutamate racemase [Treponema sp.]|nr:glutamate racemase [Treponema sp.]